jgi:thioesterase domain-containing protein
VNTDALQDYLYQHIPLTRAMQVEVLEAEPAGVRLAAPLGPNINHRDTVFGGSACAVAVLSAWALLHVRLQALGLDGRVVIHANTMRYDRPISGTFTAVTLPPDPAAWDRFMRTLERRRRARITLIAELFYDGRKAGEMSGEFVAMNPETEREPT